MKAIYIQPENIRALQKQLDILNTDNIVRSCLFFMAGETVSKRESITLEIKKFNKPLVGCIIPELIFNGSRKDNGILIIPLKHTLIAQRFDLNDTSEKIITQLEKTQNNSIEPESSLFTFLDALSPNKDLFIESLFNFFGINPTYIGGGAGSLKFEPFDCIIDNDGFHNNAAVIGWINKKIALGVAHGWNSISEPLKVTKTSGNEIISINWKTAYEVYQNIIEEHSGKKLSPEHFFDLAKSYPLGIIKIDAEMVVRDPIKTNNGSIFTVDDVNEGEYVQILHGNIDSLLSGAQKAREIAYANISGRDYQDVFCIDCISRVLFMEDNFDKELKIISKNNSINGILTIGEIANPGETYLEIFNKTVVIGIW